MSLPPSLCPHCNAPITDVICKFCGSLTAQLNDVNAERQALHAVHKFMAEQPTEEKQADFLKHAFVPTYPPVLIDAGVQCVPLIDLDNLNKPVPAAAARRLRAVMLKLKLHPETAESQRAQLQFEKLLQDCSNVERRNLMIGVVMFIVLPLLLFACVVGLGLWWFSR